MIPAGLLPEGTKWCIAGGWAACPALAKDQDIWVLVDADGDPHFLREERDRLLSHLRQQFGDLVVEHDSERLSDPKDYDNTMVRILKVAQFRLEGREIHLLIADAPSASYLLRTFDISTHQVAIEDTGGVVTGEGWTGPHEPPVMLQETPTTHERLVKIAMRYGHVKTFARSRPVDRQVTPLTDDDIPF